MGSEEVFVGGDGGMDVLYVVVLDEESRGGMCKIVYEFTSRYFPGFVIV